MRILVNGHAPCGMTRVQHKSINVEVCVHLLARYLTFM